MLRIRNSCLASASSTWCPTSVCVAVLFGAKTKSWTRHPHSGRICRSPSAVPMMMRTDSSMLASYRLSWMAPFGPTEKGNLKPTPRKLLIETPDARAGYAAAIATSTTRLQLGQVTTVRPCRSSTWSPSGALHSGQTSPLGRPALTASMISYQTDSSAVREEGKGRPGDQRRRRPRPDAKRDPHSPAAARPRHLGALVSPRPCVDYRFLRPVELGLGHALRSLGLLRRHDVRRRLLAGGRPPLACAGEFGLPRRFRRRQLFGPFLGGIGGSRRAPSPPGPRARPGPPL